MVQAKQLALICFLVGGIFVGGCSTNRTLVTDTNTNYSEVFSNWPLHIETLPNGLRILFVRDVESPVVSYGTWFAVGSSLEKKGSTGLAHLFEHLMFKGTKQFPNKPFFRLVEARGGVVNAFTQRDATVYYQVIPPHLLKKVIQLEADRLNNLRITTKELAAEKKVVFQERQLRVESNVMAQAFEKLNERLFLGHPYGRPVIGYKEDLENATIQDCLQFFEQHYLPENALVVVAGNFDFKQTRKWIRDFYLSKSNSKIKKFAKAVVPPAPQLEKSEAVTVRHEVASDSLLIGYPLPSMYHDDAEALSMAAWYLFGMASSPMVDRMVRKTQVATSVNGSASFEKHGGAFLVNVDLRNGISGEQGLNLLDQVLNDSMEDGISNEALQNMKRKMLYSLFNEGKSVVGVADWFGSGLFYWNDPGRMRAVFEKYQDMTGESLERVIRKYLLGAKRVVVKVTR